MHPVFDEMIEGDGQFAVIVPTVMREFNFNSVEDETSSQAEHRPSWRFQHFDGAPCELPADPVPAAGMSMICQADLLP